MRPRIFARIASVLILAAGFVPLAGCTATIVQDNRVEQSTTSLCQDTPGWALVPGAGHDRANHDRG